MSKKDRFTMTPSINAGAATATMRTPSLLSPSLWLVLFVIPSIDAFTVTPRTTKSPQRSQHEPALFLSSNNKQETQTLGLLTFDLDDTLYPIAPVEAEANEAVVKAMEQFGFPGLQRDDLLQTAREIREELSREDPNKAAILTHREVRELAIRREMEKAVTARKLEALAADEATTVDALDGLVTENAQEWAKAAVSDSQVRAVSTAWEMERHHSAERHLYPEVLNVLQQIKQDHPSAIIGAVTDGRSNPILMTFTLSRFFDFACSWEDDQGGARQAFFQELEDTGGEASKLTWIYDEARYKYAIFKQAADGMGGGEISELVYPDTYDDRVWIHVGDDLAFDVGGSAACGAKTIYAELAEKYEQTARQRFDFEEQPSWSTAPSNELKMRYEMSDAAQDKVDIRLHFLTRLPEAINAIVDGEPF